MQRGTGFSSPEGFLVFKYIELIKESDFFLGILLAKNPPR